MKSRYIGVVAVLAIGCASPSHPGDPGTITAGVQVQSGREFDIQAGREVQLEGTLVRVQFIGVSGESRCPSDVQCVWAGNAVVRLGLSSTGIPSTEAGLNTTLDPKSTSFAGYSIRLAALKPYPRSGTAITPGSYVATLEIRPL